MNHSYKYTNNLYFRSIMRVAIIDNFDSFTYNLVHYVEDILQQEVDVFRNNLEDISVLLPYSHFILSPGPGLPQESGKLMEIIQKYGSSKKILGICLGLQAIGVHFGAHLHNLETIKHGVQEDIVHFENGLLFTDLPSKLEVGRYHSWSIEIPEKNAELTITAKDSDGCVMAIKHKTLPIEAVQFHPESIMTPMGKKMIENWLRLI